MLFLARWLRSNFLSFTCFNWFVLKEYIYEFIKFQKAFSHKYQRGQGWKIHPIDARFIVLMQLASIKPGRRLALIKLILGGGGGGGGAFSPGLQANFLSPESSKSWYSRT